MLPLNIQNQTLAVLDGLPPIGYLANCRTEDQWIHICKLRELYSALATEFKAYFAGEENTLDKVPDKDQEFYGLLRDRYLTFYQVIRHCWPQILAAMQESGIEPNDIPANSPGEALIRAIENDCAAFASPAFEAYFRWTPTKARELARQDRELSEASARGYINERDLAKYHRSLKETRKAFAEYMDFFESCIAVAEQVKTRNPNLQRALRDYKQVKRELDSNVQGRIHPRKKIKGHEWLRGEKTTMARKGGTLNKT